MTLTLICSEGQKTRHGHKVAPKLVVQPTVWKVSSIQRKQEGLLAKTVCQKLVYLVSENYCRVVHRPRQVWLLGLLQASLDPASQKFEPNKPVPLLLYTNLQSWICLQYSFHQFSGRTLKRPRSDLGTSRVFNNPPPTPPPTSQCKYKFRFSQVKLTICLNFFKLTATSQYRRHWVNLKIYKHVCIYLFYFNEKENGIVFSVKSKQRCFRRSALRILIFARLIFNNGSPAISVYNESLKPTWYFL